LGAGNRIGKHHDFSRRAGRPSYQFSLLIRRPFLPAAGPCPYTGCLSNFNNPRPALGRSRGTAARYARARQTRCSQRADTTGAIDSARATPISDEHKDPRAALQQGAGLFPRDGDPSIRDFRLPKHVLENTTAFVFSHELPDVLLELGPHLHRAAFLPAAPSATQQHAFEDPIPNGANGPAFLVGSNHYRNWKRVNSYKDDLDGNRGGNLPRPRGSAIRKNDDAARLNMYACYALAG
jgi:hypothetical protein